MTKYRVRVTRAEEYDVTVEAETPEQAEIFAEQAMDGMGNPAYPPDNVEPLGDSYLDIDEVEEL